jgi:hypothetical protein
LPLIEVDNGRGKLFPDVETELKEYDMVKKKAKTEYIIIKKRSGRYAVKGKDGKFVNGEAKVEILLKEKKIKLTAPKPKEEASQE